MSGVIYNFSSAQSKVYNSLVKSKTIKSIKREFFQDFSTFNPIHTYIQTYTSFLCGKHTLHFHLIYGLNAIILRNKSRLLSFDFSFKLANLYISSFPLWFKFVMRSSHMTLSTLRVRYHILADFWIFLIHSLVFFLQFIFFHRRTNYS